jgi:ferrochelatase
MAFISPTDSIQPHRFPTGILIVNSGTPATPEPGEIRKYLGEFLSDRRVIRWPRWLWLPLLHLIILRVRPARVASKYRDIWTEAGSPLLRDSLAMADGLERKLQGECEMHAGVAVGMRYGHPSIGDGLRELRDRGAERLIILPLFPQYSHVTVASVYDAVFEELRRWRQVPKLEAVRGYHLNPTYIGAITQSIEAYWQVHGKPDRLLISYHGIPLSYAAAGDPYYANCTETTERIVDQLQQPGLLIESSFQSRFGPEAWTQPYTDALLAQWGQQRRGRVDVICPGFAIDCLETLHEIAIEGRELYLDSGKDDFHYIPALNACREHIEILAKIIHPYLQIEQHDDSMLAKNIGDEL